MKIRSNYVSNSSSSSFIISKDLSEKGISCLKLNEAQKNKINNSNLYDETIGLDLNKDFWITEFIYDGDDKKWDIIENSGKYFIYSDGQMGGEPYNETDFNEYQINGDKSVYLRKEHDENKQMKFKKFIKEFNENYGKDTDVLIEYISDNRIILKPITE